MTVAGRVRDGLRAAGVEPGDRVLAAVSGGLDSTVLLRTLAEAGQPVVAAHVDHGLRPDGPADGAFVAALAGRLGVPVVLLAVDVEAGNVQSQARRARYDALAAAAQVHDCAVVATGHTATDQAETVLAALARGAGLRGLAGMPPSRPLGPAVRLVRPLLAVSRAEVHAEAEARGWGWREDASNQSEVYRRNRLRHNVMPSLREEMDEGVDLRMAASADAARAALSLVQDRLDTISPAPGRLDLAGLRPLSVDVLGAVLVEALARWAPQAARSRAVVGRLANLVAAEVGAVVDSGGLRVWRERDALRLGETAGPAGTLDAVALDAVPRRFPADPWVEIVDADRVAGADVRGWREGDRLRPLGLDGSVLVSDLLRDRGVPRADRPGVPVVVVDGEVAWVVGHRLAAWAAVGPETGRAARWAWHRGGEAG